MRQDRDIHLSSLGRNESTLQKYDVSNQIAQHKETSANLSESPSNQSALNENWKSQFNGKWKIIHQENAMESWYPMAGINFLIRPIALKVLMTLTKTIDIQDNIIQIERSFDGRKYWKASIKIGVNKESAEVLETELDGIKSYFCCWINETEKAIIIEFEPFDQERGIRIIHRREILANGQLKMDWDGYHLGTKETGVMTTYFDKVV